MTPMLEPLRRYADFEGRSRRSEFWAFTALIWGLLIFGAVSLAVSGSTATGSIWIIGMFSFVIPGLAVSVRRLHDSGKSGWWLLLLFVPFAGAAALFIFYLMDSTHGPNRYGEDPKGRAPFVPPGRVVEVHHHHYADRSDGPR
jgi:uncharacterized membrane protein YhaH (DUF805 family)